VSEQAHSKCCTVSVANDVRLHACIQLDSPLVDGSVNYVLEVHAGYQANAEQDALGYHTAYNRDHLQWRNDGVAAASSDGGPHWW